MLYYYISYSAAQFRLTVKPSHGRINGIKKFDNCNEIYKLYSSRVRELVTASVTIGTERAF
jgi:hypothetical protein